MPFCANCGREIAEYAGFCTLCGKPAAATVRSVEVAPPPITVSSVKRALPFIIGITVAGLVGFCGLVFLSVRGLMATDAEARAYADSVIPAITTSWDAKELTSRASPELLAAAPADKTKKLMSAFAKRLGPLKRHGGARGQVHTSLTTSSGKVTVGRYVSQVTFEKAPGTIQLGIIKRQGDWRILEFRVNSDALMP